MGLSLAIGNQLETIAKSLEPLKGAQLVKIAPKEQGVEVLVIRSAIVSAMTSETSTMMQRLSSVQDTFLGFITSSRDVRQRDEETLGFFQKVFGEKRLKRLGEKATIPLDQPFTKNTIEKLFVQSAEVEITDLEELLAAIASQSPQILFLSEEETKQLRADFQNIHSIDDCTNLEIEKLFSLLVPFKEIKHIFLNKPPRLSSISFDSGKTFYGKRDRVNICETMRRQYTSEELWAMFLAKKLIDRELPKGVVLRSGCGGFCKVHEIVHGGGAFKTFILGLGKEIAPRERYIFYRGTRPLPGATGWVETVFEDFRKIVGSRGPIATAQKTKELLTDPRLGFVSSPGDHVTAVGNSLGGAHVMHDAEHLPKIITVVSPGVDLDTAKKYAEKVNNDELGFRPDITHYFEDKDVCDQAGEAHIGLGCDPEKATVRVCILQPQRKGEQASVGTLEEELQKVAQMRKVLPDNSDKQRQLTEYISGYVSDSWKSSLTQQIKLLLHIKDIPQALAEVITAFRTVHNRNTLAKPHRVLEISNQNNLQLLETVLNHKTSPIVDPRWEKIRRIPEALLAKM
jgi:hypothetical protein